MQQKPLTQGNLAIRYVVVLGVLLTAIWCATVGSRKLLNPDEGRYAEIPREMVVSGDWLTPRLNDLKYFEKPPLQYWATAVAFQLFGMNEFSARLWVGLTGLAGIFVAGWIGFRLFGKEPGLIAAAVLASTLMYTALGHINTLDMGLAFFMLLAIGGFLLAQNAAANSSQERNGMLLAWGATALAVLSKGVVAVALPGLTLLAYTAVERDFATWKRLHVGKGMTLFLIIAAPWFIWVSIVNPEFASFFFLREHVQRYFTDVADRVEPWWYFVPLLAAGAFPWTSFAAAALPSSWRLERQSVGFKSRRFLILWIGVNIVFFSASQSKLPAYIVPIFPALALLVADSICRHSVSANSRHLLGVAVVALAAMGYAVFGPLPTHPNAPAYLFVEVFNWATVGFALGAIGATLGWLLVRRQRVVDAFVVAGAGFLLLWTCLLVDFEVLRHLRSGHELVQSIEPVHDAKKPLYSVHAYDHSLSFYLRRSVTLVEYKGELAFGQRLETEKSIPTLQQFVEAWRGDPSGTIAVMTPDAFRWLAGTGLPMTVIGRNLHLIVVKKP